MQADAALAEAVPGANYWFWLTNRGPGRQPHLLLSPQTKDPEGRGFAEEVRAVASGLGMLRRDHFGVMKIEPTGMPCFRSEAPEEGALRTLYRLVDRQGADRPGLRRLVGAYYVQFSAEEDAVETRDDSRWSSLLPEPISVAAWSQVTSTASVLRRLTTDSRLAFWLATDGADPTLILRETPPDRLEDFQVEVARVHRRLGDRQGIQGLGRVDEEGFLVLLVADSSPPVLPLLGAYISAYAAQEPMVGRLFGAKVERRSASGQVELEEPGSVWASEPPPVSADHAVLQRLQEVLQSSEPGTRLFFWFTSRSFNGVPSLILTPVDQGQDAHRDAVTTLCRGAPLASPVSGLVAVNDAGAFRFQASRAAPGFLADLARFAISNRRFADALSRLRDARFRALENGEIVDQQGDEELWREL